MKYMLSKLSTEEYVKLENKIKIIRNLNETQKDEAINIVYQAFEKKFNELELRPKSKEQAIRIIKSSVNFEYGFYAIQDDKVLGGAGLVYNKNIFSRFPFKLLLKEFGFFGACWRFLFNRIAGHKTKPNEIYIRALAVDPIHRGKKIGTMILNAVFDFAKQNSYDIISLDVVNTNEGAHRLYKRLGFVDIKIRNFGSITRRAGFTSSIYMEKYL